MSKPAIFSFFSGSGFLDLGFEKNGYEICFINEFHQPFMDAYTHSRKVMKLKPPRFGHDTSSVENFLAGKPYQILKTNMATIKSERRLIGFIGGPPCPDFSIGGKNKGRNGENGRLSGVYADLICKLKPDFFLFENVKGLWRTKRHRAFYDDLKTKLERKGYTLTDRLTNAIEFGVPQDRERIFLFGIRKELLENNPSSLHWEQFTPYPNKNAFAYAWPERDTYLDNSKRKCPEGIPEELTIEHWFKRNSVSSHPNSKNFFKPRAGLKKFQSVDEGDDSKKSFKRLHRWRYSPTACYGNNEVHLHPYKSRRISAAEALAIQSLPVDFELPQNMTLSDMFKTIGNGVPYLMAKGVALVILDFLGESDEKSNRSQSGTRDSRIAA